MKKRLIFLCFLFAVLGCEEQASTDAPISAEGVSNLDHGAMDISIINKNEMLNEMSNDMSNDISPLSVKEENISEEELKEIDRANSEASVRVSYDKDTLPQKLASGGPTHVVGISIKGMQKGKTSNMPAIEVELQNLTKETISIKPILHTYGLISTISEMPLESTSLQREGNVSFSIDAEKLPIQSLRNISQGRIELEVTLQTPAGPLNRTILSTVFYYKHFNNYKEVSVFDINVFLSEHKGILINSIFDRKEMAQVIGRIYDGKEFKEISYLDDSNVVKKLGNGEIREVGMDISVGDMSELKELLEVNR